MPRAAAPKLSQSEQSARFIEAARKLGAEENEAAFKAKLAVIARQKPKTSPEQREPARAPTPMAKVSPEGDL